MGKKGKGKGKKAEPPKEETPDFLLDLDTVYVRTSKTQLKVQPKAELINEPPTMNMSMGLNATTGKQLFTIHYKKPVTYPSVTDVATETDKPQLLYVKPAEIIARYFSLAEEDLFPVVTNVPHESKYVVEGETKVLKHNQDSMMRDLEASLLLSSDSMDSF